MGRGTLNLPPGSAPHSLVCQDPRPSVCFVQCPGRCRMGEPGVDGGHTPDALVFKCSVGTWHIMAELRKLGALCALGGTVLLGFPVPHSFSSCFCQIWRSTGGGVCVMLSQQACGQTFPDPAGSQPVHRGEVVRQQRHWPGLLSAHRRGSGGYNHATFWAGV